MLGDMYFILGSCYFELEDYNNASGAYKSAISIYDLNSEYYRDYAIALARMNKTEKASGVLDEALIKGLTEDNIYLVKAEIDLAESHYSEAEVNFLECLRLTDSYNIMNRAYIMCSKTYEKAGDKIEDADAKNINLLEEASVKLPVDLRLMVNTRLAEAYVRQGTLSGDNEYYRKAVDLFTDCIRMGWDNYNIRNSLSMLYYMTGEYVMAYDELNYMLEKYGENYNTYKRLAYLEADVQSSKANEDRDYTIFREYYKKASELYHKDKKNDKGDAEMDFLDGIYREMLEGRWFDE
jgi:serine/threonine-protein kinase